MLIPGEMAEQVNQFVETVEHRYVEFLCTLAILNLVMGNLPLNNGEETDALCGAINLFENTVNKMREDMDKGYELRCNLRNSK